MIQIRSIVQKVTFGTFRPYWAPSDPCGHNFHMCEGVRWDCSIIGTVLDPAKSNDSNWINSSESQLWDIFGHIGHLLALPGPISEFCHMHEWWPMLLLQHNRNRFRPFPAKSNDSNSINSRKNLIFAIFSHLGHLSGPLGPNFIILPHV